MLSTVDSLDRALCSVKMNLNYYFFIYIIIYNINTVYIMLNKYDKLQITRVQYPGTVLNHIHSTVYTVYDNMI